MTRAIWGAVALFLAAACPAWAQKDAPQPDPIIQFSNEDAAMNAAIAEARSTYGQFLAHFEAAGAADQANYMVKVGLPTADGGVEHIWVDNLRREGGRLSGALANEPAGLPGMHRGSHVQIDDDLVSDWALITPEGLYGSYTTRVMLPYMDPDTAAEVRLMLAPSPLPASWSS